MKVLRIVPLIVAIAILSACSEYNKILKSDDYAKKFELANSLYDEGQYARSVALYEQVYQRFPKEGEGELAYFRIGKSYYNEEDYYMAGYFLGEFPKRFMFSPKVEEATFLTAMCSVHNSPEPSLDQTETELAINNLQQFVDRFPESQLVDSSNHIMDRLRFKLETKDFEAVKLYSKTENYRAATTAADDFVKNYPMSRYKEEASYILVNNSYLLAKNSIESKKLERTALTLERYRNFVIEFPESKYLRALGSISDEMEKELERLEELEKLKQ